MSQDNRRNVNFLAFALSRNGFLENPFLQDRFYEFLLLRFWVFLTDAQIPLLYVVLQKAPGPVQYVTPLAFWWDRKNKATFLLVSSIKLLKSKYHQWPSCTRFS